MSLELTNLLPEQTTRAFRRMYFIRLLVVGVSVFLCALLIQYLLLLPSYIYTLKNVQQKTISMESINKNSITSGEKELQNKKRTITETTQYLLRLQKVPSATEALRTVLTVPRTGISLSGFTFAKDTGTTTKAQMSVSGIALTRDTLRQYVSSLENIPSIEAVDLPISAYAKDSEIPFTITISGHLIP
jgi:hypothetical protein